jgi:hypothetical protein
MFEQAKAVKAVKQAGLNADTPATADTLRAGKRAGGHV